MKTDSWPDPPDLETDEVHLWWARVVPPEGEHAVRPEDSPWLSEAEQVRAARFRFERDRVRYIGRQEFLRGLLGRYLERAPAGLSFAASRHGKPFLEERALRPWCFNLSHSDEWVLVGISRERAVGVDVEAYRLRTELDRMAASVFTERECATLHGLEHEARLGAFFRGWTRKEAALKATGEGFAREPRTLEIGLAARHRFELWPARGEPVLAGYELADLEAPEEYGAALCADCVPWRPVIASSWSEAVLL